MYILKYIMAKERELGPALFSTSNSSPASSITFLHLFFVPQQQPWPRSVEVQICSPGYNYVRTKPVRHLCVSRLSCVYATLRCGSLRVRTVRCGTEYGTARVESSRAKSSQPTGPVQTVQTVQASPAQLTSTRAELQNSHLSALTLFPTPFRDRQTFLLRQSLPPRVSTRTPASLLAG